MKLLFVCTGNTCRSAMAESLMRKRLEEAGLADKIQVRSAGVAAAAGQRASEGAQNVLKARGLDGSVHRATTVDAQLVKWADLILTMSASHKRILERSPEVASGKLFTLKEFLDTDPANTAVLKEIKDLKAAAQTKQSLWLAERAGELDALRARHAEGDKSAQAGFSQLQQQLQEFVQQDDKRLSELERQLPNYDVADPYGCGQEVYDRTALEIEALLDMLLVRLRG